VVYPESPFLFANKKLSTDYADYTDVVVVKLRD
jgi:hypothetical protein